MRGSPERSFEMSASVVRRVGVGGRPIEAAEELKVARAVKEQLYQAKDGKSRLWFYKGRFYAWSRGLWVERTRNEVLKEVHRSLEDALYRHWNGATQAWEMRRYKPNWMKSKGVVGSLESLVTSEREEVPFWFGGAETNPETSIGFLDYVVDVLGGEVRCVERTQDWFDPCVLGTEYGRGGDCPRWMQALDEWGKGSEEWKELLQRWLGYCLLNTRKYEKWMLFYGKVRAGKGTITHVMQRLMGPTRGYLGTSLDVMASHFGLNHFQVAKMVVIGEVATMETKDAERAARIMKNVVGRDPIDIDVKYEQPLRNVYAPGAITVLSNEIPHLPNKGRGMSSKMLVLPFEVSFEGREDPDLLEDLMRELPGIARWVVEGARKLEAVKRGEERWPLTMRGKRVVEQYSLLNNVFDAFVQARF